MISHVFNLVLYQPLYNAFIGFIGTFPWIDAGIVVVIFTLLIKLVLFPLSQKSVRSQIEMKKIQPEIDELKIKYKDNKQEQALKTMALYKEKGVSPFSGIILALIQLPILIALYMVFYRGGITDINTGVLYSFIHVPEHINRFFLGIFDITEKNVYLAILVAIGQYYQIKFTMPSTPKKAEGEKKDVSFQGELAKSMSMQMKYVMPALMFFVAMNFKSLVSLYLITSSLFAIGQELYMRKKILEEDKNASIINKIK
jgi:YidC/Oxa1 family membrane protein insertase